MTDPQLDVNDIITALTDELAATHRALAVEKARSAALAREIERLTQSE